MKDPRHGRDIPTGRDVATVLRRFFHQIGLHVARQLEHGRRPNFQQWVQPLSQALFPFMARYFAMGGNQAQRRILIELAKRRLAKSAHGIQMKKVETIPALIGSFDVLLPQVQDAIAHMVYNFVQETLHTAAVDAETAYQRLREAQTRGIEAGESTRTMTEDVQRIFDEPARAFRIATTETSRAMHAGQLAACQQSKVVSRVEWLASADACPICIDLDGKQVEVGEPFLLIPKSKAPYNVVYAPPAHPHCCLPGTRIKSAGLLVSGYRAHYRGTCFRIEFANGDSLSCTQNHMLLTRQGLAFASSLMQGDEILNCDLRKFTIETPDDDRKPALIEEIVDSLSVSFGMTTSFVMPTAEHFHGDGALCQGKIDIVTSDRFLRNDQADIPFIQKSEENGFERRTEFTRRLGAKSNLATMLLRLGSTLDSGMSGLREAKAFFLGRFRHANQLGFSHRSGNDASRNDFSPDCETSDIESLRNALLSFSRDVGFQGALDIKTLTTIEGGGDFIPDSHAGFFKIIANRMAADAKKLRDTLSTFPGLVAGNQIVKIDPFHYDGPVYDLQTESSLYIIGDGLISGNCLCAMNEVIA